MYAVIDRFEGDFAVVEMDDRSMIDIERVKIPRNAKEGDVLIIDDEKISVDHEETARRKAEIEKLMEGIWEE